MRSGSEVRSRRQVEIHPTAIVHPDAELGEGVMIGPYDISGSLGIPGQLEHPRVRQACARVLEVCQRRRKPCGTQLIDPTPEGVEAVFAQGYRFVVLASDVFLLWKWSERMRVLIDRTRQTARRPRTTHARAR